MKKHIKYHDREPDASSGVKQKQSNERELQASTNETPYSQTIHYQATRKKHYHNNERNLENVKKS